MTQVKQARTMAFRSLRECLANPGDLMIYDFAKMSAPQTIHLGFAALDEFQKVHGDFPEPFNADHQVGGCQSLVVVVANVCACVRARAVMHSPLTG